MNREIKFRGKWNSEEWAYGDLHLNCKHPHIHSSRGDMFYISLETIGQFTGLTDKNGKEIYEGDIVEFIYCPKSLNQKVIAVVGVNKFNLWCALEGSEYHIENTLHGEIIGNIHDNPELLNDNNNDSPM